MANAAATSLDIHRYDRQAPRYTSYPPATAWQALGDAEVRAALGRVAAQERPVSLYVHVPFCERMCLFCGCNTTVRKSREGLPRYLDAVVRELGMARELAGPRACVQTHFGGGTPTFLSAEELTRVGRALFAAFPPAPAAELSVEVHPLVTREEQLAALRALGFTRLSMGVQDFNGEVQRLVERDQSEEVTVRTFETARRQGFKSINMDLMYGLPGQSAETLAYSARRVAELGADRIAVFGYAHVPWMKPHQRKLNQYELPDTDLRWRMAQAAREVLLARGYVSIGFDHYARPDDELAVAARTRRLSRNFQGYTVLGEIDLIGLGVSAISDAGGAYFQSAKRLSTYLGAIEADRFAVDKGLVLSRDDKMRRFVIMGIMCNLTADYGEFEARFGEPFARVFARELAEAQRLADDGVVDLGAERLEVTERGRPFLRNVAVLFDAYAASGSDAEPRGSRTV